MIKFILLTFFLAVLIINTESESCSDYKTTEKCMMKVVIDADPIVRDTCTWTDNKICADKACGTGDSNWYIGYVGKSTQFKLYDPCKENIFLKIKMEDLTEFSGADDTKTTNKEPGFADTQWSWDTASGIDNTFQGNDVLANYYRATLSKQAGNYAKFKLSTYLFVTAGSILKVGETVETNVAKNSVKFGVEIDNWTFMDSSNYLVLCLGLMTNGGAVTNAEGSTTYYLNGFEIVNDKFADCDGETIDVVITRNTNGNNHLDICFKFEKCSGKISYDPTVAYEGKAGWIHTSWLMVTFANIFIGTFLLL